MFVPPHFHPSRPGVVAPVRLDPAGLAGPTPGQVRGTAWRRAAHGWYVPSYVDARHPWQRAVEAAVCLPRYGGVTGWAALAWEHARWFSGLAGDGFTLRPVTLATGLIHVRAQPGIVISEERCSPADLVVVDGLPLTRSVCSTWFEMRYAASAWDAARALDMAAYSDLVSIAELRDYAGEHPGWTGVPQVRTALTLADENAWSPTEVRMREIWQDAGLGRPLCNPPMFDRSGRLIGTPDLLDPVAGVVGEYEGALHLAGHQRAHDVRREGVFRHHGLEPVTMVAADLPDPSDFLARLRAAYGRARTDRPGDRSWTLEHPPWWTPTQTVAQRRALDPRMRERLLRHRWVS